MRKTPVVPSLRILHLNFRCSSFLACRYPPDSTFSLRDSDLYPVANMKASILASLLFGVAIAADAQVPLKDKAQGWFDKAKSYIPSVTPSVNNPVDTAAAAVAALKVQKVNIRNYQRILSPKLEGEEEWIIYATGGNKSCFGRCNRANTAWNVSSTITCPSSRL